MKLHFVQTMFLPLAKNEVELRTNEVALRANDVFAVGEKNTWRFPFDDGTYLS